jgi:Tol biopolymer transport system component
MVRTASLLAGICVIVIGIMVGPSAATFSGENGRISFARFDGKHVEIFSANPNGSHIKKLTESRPRHAVSFISDWSPDGQLIAFDSDRKDIDGRKTVQIYVM